MNGVAIYQYNVQAHQRHRAQHWLLLAPAERERASRLRLAADQARFILARATLRQLLGVALGMPAQSVTLQTNAFGKPGVTSVPALQFNTSHCGDWVVHALSTSAPVGVDVEAIAADWRELDLLTGDVLTPEEDRRVRSLPMGERAAAFTAIWVRKEAYVKACGQGLSRLLRDIRIFPARSGEPERLSERSQLLPVAELTLCEINVGQGYAASLAVLGPATALRHVVDD